MEEDLLRCLECGLRDLTEQDITTVDRDGTIIYACPRCLSYELIWQDEE